MSCSRILIHGPALSLKSYDAGNCRKQRRKIVCCCPWSGSDKKKKNENIDQNKMYENISMENLKVNNPVEVNKLNKNFSGNNSPFSLSLLLPSMADQFPFNFITFLLSLEPFSLIWKKVESGHDSRLPPGPSTLHLIGLLPYLIQLLPRHYMLRELAKTYGPLMHVQVGELSMIVVSSAKIAKEVLKTHDLACADRPKSVAVEMISYNYTDIVASPYGEYWRWIRNVCILELLSAKNVRSFEYIRKDEGSVLIESIRSTSRSVPFNLTEKISWFMNSVTCRAVFGKVPTDRGRIIMLIREAMSLGGDIALVDLFPSMEVFNSISWSTYRLSKIAPKMNKILDNIIDKHRKNLVLTRKGNGELGSEDFIDVLLRLKESDEFNFSLTDDNNKAVISDMFAGGTESSSTTVVWAMAELMKNPHVMAKAQHEIRRALCGKKTIEESEIRKLKYLKLIIKETLRLHPPNSLIPRACREEIEIDGYHLPVNAPILVNIWSIGRDPKYWHNPESFEPERFEKNPVDFLGSHFEYIPFGAGKRICPGMTFGLANVEFVLAQLLYHFDWKLPPGISPVDLDMSEADGISITRKSSLSLIATPYDPTVEANVSKEE